MMIVRLVKTSFLLALLCSCSGGGESSAINVSTPVILQSGKIIDNEDMSAGFKGIDADNNGIRDDIDRLIAQKYSTSSTLKNAAEQEAKAIQLFAEATSMIQARVAGNNVSRSEDCLLQVSPDFKTYEVASKEIEALTANTKERFTAYWNANKLAGGMVFSQPSDPVCD